MAAAPKLLLVICASVLAPTQAAAVVTDYVKTACRDDYYAYCGDHAVGSPSLRMCMRRAQFKLSRPCLRALRASGEATRRDEIRYRAHSRRRK